MTDYTREELLDICERAVVAHENWSNRDTAVALKQLGSIWALLKAGCEFFATKNPSFQTIDVQIDYRGFEWFEGTGDPHESRDALLSTLHGYLPTPERLSDMSRMDWYT